MKKCPNCQIFSESDKKYCAHCGTSLKNVEITPVVYVIIEGHDGQYVVKGDRYQTLAELKEKNSQMLQAYSGMYVIRAVVRHLDSHILFRPIESYEINLSGKILKIDDPVLSIRISKPS